MKTLTEKILLRNLRIVWHSLFWIFTPFAAFGVLASIGLSSSDSELSKKVLPISVHLILFALGFVLPAAIVFARKKLFYAEKIFISGFTYASAVKWANVNIIANVFVGLPIGMGLCCFILGQSFSAVFYFLMVPVYLVILRPRKTDIPQGAVDLNETTLEKRKRELKDAVI